MNRDGRHYLYSASVELAQTDLAEYVLTLRHVDKHLPRCICWTLNNDPEFAQRVQFAAVAPNDQVVKVILSNATDDVMRLIRDAARRTAATFEELARWPSERNSERPWIHVDRDSRTELAVKLYNVPRVLAIALRGLMQFHVPTMRAGLVTVEPKTDTVLDAKQWAGKMAAVVFDSRAADSFRFVEECGCATGCAACLPVVELSVWNESTTRDLDVWTDDLVCADARVAPIHRTVAVTRVETTPGGVALATAEEHLLTEGYFCTFWPAGDRAAPLKGRATQCTDRALTLAPLFADEPFEPTVPREAVRTAGGALEPVGRVGAPQLLHTLGPGQRVVLSAQIQKGIGQTHAKWSPIAGQAVHDPTRPGVVAMSVPTDGSLPARTVLRVALQVACSRLREIAESAHSQLIYPDLPQSGK